jgi:hypothetical protein
MYPVRHPRAPWPCSPGTVQAAVHAAARWYRRRLGAAEMNRCFDCSCGRADQNGSFTEDRVLWPYAVQGPLEARRGMAQWCDRRSQIFRNNRFGQRCRPCRCRACRRYAKYREFLLQTLERRRRKETAARSPDCASVGHLPFRSLALRATGRSDSRCRRKPKKCSDELLITGNFSS